jgi:choline dehydrogenase-like flavoprotein
MAAVPLMFSLMSSRPDGPSWGAEFKANLEHDFTRTMYLFASGTSLPVDSNNVTIDPTHKDRWDRPSLRITYKDHADDLALASFLQDRSAEILDAAGAVKAWRGHVGEQNSGAHLLGTCRMGDDPQTSVVDKNHRSHDIPNLFICDGSSMVTSGRGQPTMTIMALAFRAAENIAAAARNNLI